MSVTQKGRILGVDYGDVRTGIALSDMAGFLASGLMTVKEKGMKATAARVVAEAEKNGAVLIVIGLPKNMDGSEGERASLVRIFAGLVEEAGGIPVTLWDERLSTVEAHRILNMTGTGGSRRRAVIDTLSAELILQNYLDAHR